MKFFKIKKLPLYEMVASRAVEVMRSKPNLEKALERINAGAPSATMSRQSKMMTKYALSIGGAAAAITAALYGFQAWENHAAAAVNNYAALIDSIKLSQWARIDTQYANTGAIFASTAIMFAALAKSTTAFSIKSKGRGFAKLQDMKNELEKQGYRVDFGYSDNTANRKIVFRAFNSSGTMLSNNEINAVLSASNISETEDVVAKKARIEPTLSQPQTIQTNDTDAPEAELPEVNEADENKQMVEPDGTAIDTSHAEIAPTEETHVEEAYVEEAHVEETHVEEGPVESSQADTSHTEENKEGKQPPKANPEFITDENFTPF